MITAWTLGGAVLGILLGIGSSLVFPGIGIGAGIGVGIALGAALAFAGRLFALDRARGRSKR
ncbi:hypothetical protein [Rathayibacter sp. VKM Ac-2760]|uniref:hypothetical protein n=1 Tax=Rathayibacter sp. VKM Ac-2760 TaxID=2609253 RepID=UPI001319A59B|nr:hypothetical protein [Rathayibacter sp. VKM Ac-2760]QHC59255.1 hypothetical protein GSU72_12325 [Rathayibacter sp. VKM Ac-2760]